MGKKLFITGIPTGGKSYLAKKIAEKINGVYVSLDDMRDELAKQEKYKKWVNFYRDKDEYEYYTKTTPQDQWQNLVNQAEGMWKGVLEKISQYQKEERCVIFEGVNILPHLAHKDLSMPGICIIGRSEKEIFERIKIEHRWGSIEELQKMEAKEFFNVQRPRYKEEAEKYGYKVFNTADDAWGYALEILNK